MVGTWVQELSDGEELVVEGTPGRSVVEDPRERAIEVRRLAQRSGCRDEDLPLERCGI